MNTPQDKASERTEIAAIFAICDCDAHRRPKKSLRFWRQDKAMLRCDLRVRWFKALAICDFGLRSPSAKPLLSVGFLAIWLHHRGDR